MSLETKPRVWKKIYLHCSAFEEFGYDGNCCPHSGCHEDYDGPPRKENGSEPIVVSTYCCNFDNTDLRTRDNCAKLARQHRKKDAEHRRKSQIKENLDNSARRLAEVRLKTYFFGEGDIPAYHDAIREELSAITAFKAAKEDGEAEVQRIVKMTGDLLRDGLKKNVFDSNPEDIKKGILDLAKPYFDAATFRRLLVTEEPEGSGNFCIIERPATEHKPR